MQSLIPDFAIAKSYEFLKLGKLSHLSTQKPSNYKLTVEDVPKAEHGFVENFMQLFSLRDRLRKMRDDINENGFYCKYPSLLGNTIFNTTVSFKSGFFEKLISPFVEELNLND